MKKDAEMAYTAVMSQIDSMTDMALIMSKLMLFTANKGLWDEFMVWMDKEIAK